jgi:hypothetical protein
LFSPYQSLLKACLIESPDLRLDDLERALAELLLPALPTDLGADTGLGALGRILGVRVDAAQGCQAL